MKGTATCYAWGRPGEWQAICVDFDLVAHGESLDEVRNEIADAIETYVSYLAELPESERARLMNRKAPVGLRVKLAFLYKVYPLLNALRIGLTNRYAFRPAVNGYTAT